MLILVRLFGRQLTIDFDQVSDEDSVVRNTDLDTEIDPDVKFGF